MKAENIYRLLLRAYPRRYRREYVESMVQCFRDQLRDANTTGKRVRLWLRTFCDLALTIPFQYWDRGGRLRDYSRVARHTIFFAHYEAASFSGPEVSLEHLLLGTLREDRELAIAVLGRDGARDIVRAIEARQVNPRRQPAVATGGFPLSAACKKALAHAFQQARNAGAKVMPRHFVMAILAQETSDAARLLRERAVDLSLL